MANGRMSPETEVPILHNSIASKSVYVIMSFHSHTHLLSDSQLLIGLVPAFRNIKCEIVPTILLMYIGAILHALF